MTREERAKRRYDKQLAKKQAADKAIKSTVKKAKSSKTGMATESQQRSISKQRRKSKRLERRMNRIADRQTKKQSGSNTGFTDSSGAKVYSAPGVTLSPRAYSMKVGSRQKNSPTNFNEKSQNIINDINKNFNKKTDI